MTLQGPWRTHPGVLVGYHRRMQIPRENLGQRIRTDTIMHGDSLKPLMSFDMDGVLCRPPLGLNVAISRRLEIPPVPPSFRRSGSYRRSVYLLLLALEAIKYWHRPPMPDVHDALKVINQYRRLVLLTGRKWVGLAVIEAWLERHGLRQYFDALRPNDTNLRPVHHKLTVCKELGVREHVDDDGSVAYYLVSHGVPRVYLRDWPRNRGLPYPEGVVVFHSLLQVADDLVRGRLEPS